jgi:flagellar export protein FliJ
MKKFRFSLHSVQTVRSVSELRAREAFSEALALHASRVRACESAQEDVLALEAMVREVLSGNFKPAVFATYSHERCALEERVRSATQAMHEAARLLEERRASWIEARKSLKVVEKLETKARAVHRSACEHEEQAMLDDRVNATAAREVTTS